MNRLDWRWIKRHPTRWARLCWWHWAIGLTLCSKAFISTHPVFERIFGEAWWPILLASAGGMCVLSALAPLNRKLQAFVASILFGVSILRGGTFIAIGFLAPDSETVKFLALAFTIHWAIFALLALKWVTISTAIGASMAVEAGWDDRGI